MEEKFNYKSIHLLLNDQGIIYYSNLKDKNFCEKLLSKLEVLEKIKKYKNGGEVCERYYIEFEEVNIHGDLLYLVIIDKIDGIGQSAKYLNYLAYKDSYTGLYNRNLWEHMMNDEINFKNIGHYTIALIDIDGLKMINDNLKISEVTTYKLVQEGRLPAFKIGRHWRLKKSDLAEYIEKLKRGERL